MFPNLYCASFIDMYFQNNQQFLGRSQILLGSYPVGVVLRGFPQLCRPHARVILDGATRRLRELGDVHDVLGVLGDDRVVPDCAACSGVVAERRVDGEDDVLDVNGK